MKTRIVKRLLACIKAVYFRVAELCFPSKISDIKEIPIIVNNFNRLTTLKLLLDSLERRGYHNIYILDNASTYPPLLDYYKECPYEVIFLGANLGFKAIWKSKEVRKRFCRDYYIYTDSDVVLSETCPDDVVGYLLDLLKNKYKYAAKIGLSLCIDDLPDCYFLKNKVLQWEQQFYQGKNEDNLYPAPVDTTFALYRPRVGLSRSRSVESYRTASPYILKHLPWYMDSDNLSEEELYYIRECKHATSWTSQN
ncbi:MAG: glycosyltransferase family 2 protein [Parabacteroides sp.]|nr:glycosyltransferase family 2 protein [Parabacteroides sp.]